VADPEWVDHLIDRVLRVVPPGSVDASAALTVNEQVPSFLDEAPLILRRGAHWEKFDAIVSLARALGLVDVWPVLCEVLDSDAEVPDPGHIVDVLGQLRFDGAAEALARQVAYFVYVNEDL
jgi:hypothetical protein